MEALPKKSRSRLSVSKKLAFGLLTTLLLFLLTELGLWMCGVRTRFESADPFVGFRQSAPLFVRDGDVFRTNPVKLAFFNPQSFPATKSSNTVRIFCLGGSTTFGHPYDDATSFCGWLRARLQDSDPQKDWQVINCGGISYASYRICLLMQELVKYQPDLFVIYEGHNEFLEDRTYEALKDRGFVGGLADSVATRTRLGSCLSSCLLPSNAMRSTAKLPSEVDTILDRSRGPELYHRDLVWRDGVVAHCELSFDRMCVLARNAGARLVLVKPAANLRNFSPFKSELSDLSIRDEIEWRSQVESAQEHSQAECSEQAVARWLRSCEIEPHHAMTLWKTGDALFAQRRFQEAEQFFQRAVDEDICPLRAISQIQTAIERAARRNGVPLIDYPRLLADRLEHTAGHRIPGDESFLDHVHPTIDENHQLAWAIYEELARGGVAPHQTDDPQRDERISQSILKDIDSRRHALALVQVVQVLSWAGKDTEALRLAEKAEEVCPGLSDVACYRGRLLEKRGDFDSSFEFYSEAVRRNGTDPLALSRLARSHLQRQEFREAANRFQEALRYTPASAPPSFLYVVHSGYGQCLQFLNRPDEAAQQAQLTEQFAPASAKAHKSLLETSEQHFGSRSPLLHSR